MSIKRHLNALLHRTRGGHSFHKVRASIENMDEQEAQEWYRFITNAVDEAKMQTKSRARNQGGFFASQERVASRYLNKKTAEEDWEKWEKIGLCILERMNRELPREIGIIGLSYPEYSVGDEPLEIDYSTELRYEDFLDIADEFWDVAEKAVKQCGITFQDIHFGKVRGRVFSNKDQYIKIYRR